MLLYSEKSHLYKTIEKLTTELEDTKDKLEELRGAKQEAVRELLTLQEQHRAELRILHNSQQEDFNARENIERKLCELRGEVIETFYSISCITQYSLCVATTL